MRRSDKEIKDMAVIEEIINKAQVCTIAMCDNNQPYIIPMNFGYRGGNFYFHSAKEGKKVDILRRNKNICIEINADIEVVCGEKPCNWSTKYFSVVGQGEAEFINEQQEKIEALDIIMEKYAGKQKFEYYKESLEKVLIIKVRIIEITAKKSG